MTGPIALAFPFAGRWRAVNSPANHVPSHGSDLLATTYAIDFVAVDDGGRSAPRGWRSLLWTESPERFVGFGAPILSPVAGTVVAAEDGEPDHEARRSIFTVVPYLSTQRQRLARGARGIAGNHVLISLGDAGPFVLLAHLKRGSIGVGVGDAVELGERIGECGNSGNSTEPHVHVQVSDSLDLGIARGLPMAFTGGGRDGEWMPRSGEVVDAG